MTNTRWIAGALVSTLVAIGASGCWLEYDEPVRPSRTSSSLSGWNTQLETYGGSMGHVVAIDAAHGDAVAYEGWDSTQVRIDAEDTSARWWAMTQLTIDGTLDHPALVPGAHLVFDGTQPGGGSGDPDFNIAVLGCSGPRRGAYSFDEPARKVTVDVTAGPRAGMRVVAFRATFGGGGETQDVTGSFVASPVMSAVQ